MSTTQLSPATGGPAEARPPVVLLVDDDPKNLVALESILEDGSFELKNVPVGKWRIVYRHEGGFHKGTSGSLGFPLEVKGDKKTMDLDPIEFEPPVEKK